MVVARPLAAGVEEGAEALDGRDLLLEREAPVVDAAARVAVAAVAAARVLACGGAALGEGLGGGGCAGHGDGRVRDEPLELEGSLWHVHGRGEPRGSEAGGGHFLGVWLAVVGGAGVTRAQRRRRARACSRLCCALP